MKGERLRLLQQRQTALTLASHERMVGRSLAVRVESQGPTEDGHWMARTGCWRNVHLRAGEGRQLPFGQLVEARITSAGPHFLGAEIS